MDYTRLGAIERPKDERDVLLGSVQAPISLPAEFLPDNTWLQRNYQGETAFCGEHAASHFLAILKRNLNAQVAQRFTPRYGVIKLKTPSSPVYDGFPVDAGTTMTAIFKWLQKIGGDDFAPLENDVTLATATYCDPTAATPAMDTDAGQNQIQSYAFGNTDFESLCQYIYQNGAVLLLIKCDDGFWGTTTPTFTTPKYGHFIVADGYTADALRVIDSADPNNAFGVKMIGKQYVTSEFFFESGTAVDLPPSIQQIATHPTLSQPEKNTLIQQILSDIEQAVGLVSKEMGQW
jgi:hypothetical protein